MTSTTTWQRMLLCSKKLISDNRRKSLLALESFLGIWFAIGFVAGIYVTGGGEGEFISYCLATQLVCWGMASTAFCDMKTKEGRINFLMQPASAWEKYLPRFLYAIVLPLIVAFIGYFFLESGRIIGSVIVTRQWLPMTMPWSFGVYVSTSDFFSLLGMYLLNQTYFFFGAILWPRLSFLKSMGIIIIVQIFFMIGGSLFLFRWKDSLYMIDHVNANTVEWAFTGITIAISVLFCWLAYWRLTRSTVVYGMIRRSKA